MAKLTDEHRAFIIKGLACFDTPTTVVNAVKQEFGLEIDRSQVAQYNPEHTKPPAKRWRLMHEQIRKAFVEQQAGIAIANKSVRLRRLERIADSAESRGNQVLALQALEQASKECGDFHTNKLKVSGQLSGTVQFKRVDTGIVRDA